MTAQWSMAGRMAQFVGDALVGLAIFLLMACLIAGDGRAQGRSSLPDGVAEASTSNIPATVALLGEPAGTPLTILSMTPERSSTGLRRTDAETAQMLLAIVFSLLVALNLGFFRHLRRTYSLTR